LTRLFEITEPDIMKGAMVAVSTMTRLWAEQPWFDSWQGQ